MIASTMFGSAWLSATLLAGLPLYADAQTPSTAASSPPLTRPIGPAPLGSFTSLLDQLNRDAAALGSTRAPDPAVARRVADTIDQLRFRPVEVADDPGARRSIREAMLALAAFYLDSDRDEAWAWMDRAFALPDPKPLSASQLPPRLQPLASTVESAHKKRGKGELGLSCTNCEVIIDGYRMTYATSYRLPAGRHDLWIFSTDVNAGRSHAEFEMIEIKGSGHRSCGVFSSESNYALLPTPEQWWAAVDYAERLYAAVRRQTTHFGQASTQELVDLLREAPLHTAIMARDRRLRQLRAKARLSLARALGAGSAAPTAPDAANEHIDAAARVAVLDSFSVLEVAKDLFLSKATQIYSPREQAAHAGPQGSIEFRCYEDCTATIEQIKIIDDEVELPVGSYNVMVFPSNPNEEPLIDFVTVDEDQPTEILFGRPPPAVPVRVTLDKQAREKIEQEVYQTTKAWSERPIFALAGSISLLGAVGWGTAIGVGGVPRLRSASAADELTPDERRTLAGMIAIPVSIHIFAAAILFAKIPPKRRLPGRYGDRPRPSFAPLFGSRELGVAFALEF